MTTAELATPERALAIGAHPDDVELHCGGTLAKWAALGCTVSLLVLTDGSKGTWDPKADRARLVARREDEQRRAATRLGIRGELTMLGWPDGELADGVRERAQVAAAIRRSRPDVVLGHDPWKRYRLHPDHRHAGFLVTDGIVAARDPLFFPELELAPHRPATLLLFEADETDHLEDIAPTLEDKFEALLCHESQLETTMGITANAADRSAPEVVAYRARLDDDAARAGAAAGLQAAEAFKRVEGL